MWGSKIKANLKHKKREEENTASYVSQSKIFKNNAGLNSWVWNANTELFSALVPSKAISALCSGTAHKRLRGKAGPWDTLPKEQRSSSAVPIMQPGRNPQSIPTGEPVTGTNHLSIPPSHAAGTVGTSRHGNTRAPPATFISTQTQATVAENRSYQRWWHSS